MAWGAGLLLATLPWLHQKFLPLWLVLTASALAWRIFRGQARRHELLALLAPQAVSLYLTALYNFGITGSVRPDALFLAWGPAGVTSARLGQGLLGLWLDARYGLLPMVPVFALGFAGPFLGSAAGTRLLAALPAALVYYLTVAAADNWAGAVCNLGRYLMPILPLVVAYVAVVLDRSAARRGALAVALALFGLSGLLALALWQDPHAANDSALLLAKSRFADGEVYVPGLFIRTWAAGAPGLVVRIAAWLLLVAGLGAWLRRAARGRGGERPLHAIATTLGLVLVLAAILERWPSRREGPALAGVPLAVGRPHRLPRRPGAQEWRGVRAQPRRDHPPGARAPGARRGSAISRHAQPRPARGRNGHRRAPGPRAARAAAAGAGVERSPRGGGDRERGGRRARGAFPAGPPGCGATHGASLSRSDRERAFAFPRKGGTSAVRSALMEEVDAPLVEFRDLAVSYGRVPALQGVTGAFPAGPTGLLGPNGAGKTTLLKTLLGFVRPDRGGMTAFGLDPSLRPLDVRRRIGYMPEADCHLPGMTAVAYVAFAGELSGLPRVRGHQPRRTRSSTTWASAKRATATSPPTPPA